MSYLYRHYKTEDGIFAFQLYQTMNRMGLDAKLIFSKIGQFEPFSHSEFRSNANVHKYLWALAESSSRDSLIGLHLGENMPVFQGHILEYMFLSSPSFGEALEKVSHYMYLISDLISFQIQENESKVCLVINFNLKNRHFIEFVLVQCLTFFQHLMQGKFKLLELYLPYKLMENKLEYIRIFDCLIHEDAKEVELIFDKCCMRWRSPSSQENLFRAHEVIAQGYLGKLQKYDLIYRIEHEIDLMLPNGPINREIICARLDKNPHTLKAELASIDTSFREIVDQYLKKRACYQLQQCNESIEQIAYSLGFSEFSAFSRAFKRWTGQTPKQYRLHYCVMKGS